MKSYRESFPIFKKHPNLIYLDTAATAQKPKVVVDAMYQFDTNTYGTVHRSVYDLAHQASSLYSEAREAVCSFLSAESSNEIIFTKGTTESINLIAYSFVKAFMKPGDEVLISEAEHHSNIVPWQMAEEMFGIKLKVIPLTDSGDLDLDALKTNLTSRTKLLSIAHISNTLGTKHPISEIVQYAHQNGTKVLLDAAQSVAHEKVDVQSLNIDFLAFSGHKLYGPSGIGVLYGKEELLEQMPPYQTGGSMVESVNFDKTTFSNLPTKFEAGTPMITQSIGLKSAIEFIEGISLKAISLHEEALYLKARQLLSGIEGLNFLASPKASGSLISFSVDGLHPLDIATMLNLKNIAIRSGHQCAQTTMRRFRVSHVARVSFGIYNTLDELDIFSEELQKIIFKLR